jgi:hypothetical protein
MSAGVTTVTTVRWFGFFVDSVWAVNAVKVLPERTRLVGGVGRGCCRRPIWEVVVVCILVVVFRISILITRGRLRHDDTVPQFFW